MTAIMFDDSTANPAFEAPINPPPDWATFETELTCPLCEYNLRGLTDSRCPECGFFFAWKELIEATKIRHRYLFEYGERRNLKTFWKTYWNTCRPRKFWRELSPAQPVVLKRLLGYWLITCCLLGIFLFGSQAVEIVKKAQSNAAMRANYPASGMTYPPANVAYPGPLQAGFWRDIWHQGSRFSTLCIAWGVIFFLWPWSTFLALLIFRYSLRQAKIRTVHLIRAILYCLDFGVLMALLIVAVFAIEPNVGSGFLALLGALVCAGITSYRLTISFSRYLRVHLPFATAFVTQLICFLAMFTTMTWIDGFSWRF